MDVIECLRDRKRIGLGIFFQDRHLHFVAQRIDRLSARNLAFGVKRAFDPVTRNAISNIEQFLVHREQLHLALRFAHHRRQLLLNANHLACMFMRELERFHEFGFRQFVRRAFDHNHIVFGADVNKIEIALGTLRMGRVSDELAVYSAYANGADWTGKWYVRNAQRSRCAVDRQNVRIVLAIGAEQNRDDLGVVKIPLRKKRPKRPVDHARSERFLFRWPAFTLEIATGKFPHGCRLFAIIDREREIILTFLDNWSRDGTGQHHGIAA